MASRDVSTTSRGWLLATAVSLALVGCGESSSSSQGSGFGGGSDNGNGSDGGNITFNEQQMLVNLTDNVLTPTFEAFAAQSIQQQQAVSDYCGLVESSADAALIAEARTAAQSSWRTTMDSWQQVEVMQVGPLSADFNALRNHVYSWPVTNSCSVDQDVVFFREGNINGTPYDISRRTDTRRGLDSLEYLLFNDSLAHSCSSDSGAVANWNAQDEQSRLLERCRFAVEVAGDVVNSGESLISQWQGDNGAAASFKTAGSAGNAFESAHAAVNAISDAMFYIDSQTKDAKLAQPLGIAANGCGDDSCLDAVESPLSQHSLMNVINNLKALEKLYLGRNNEGDTALGFYDFMVDLDDKAGADQMAADITAAIAAAEAIEASLLSTLQTNPDEVSNLHAAVKRITDQMKTNYITLLSLELPATSAGDND